MYSLLTRAISHSHSHMRKGIH